MRRRAGLWFLRRRRRINDCRERVLADDATKSLRHSTTTQWQASPLHHIQNALLKQFTLLRRPAGISLRITLLREKALPLENLDISK